MSPKQTASAPHTDRASFFLLFLQSLSSFSLPSPFRFVSHAAHRCHTHAHILPLIHFPSFIQFSLQFETAWLKRQTKLDKRLNRAILGIVSVAWCRVAINHSYSLCVCSIVASWEVNAIGHPVVLPLSVCEELLQVINDSNRTLPASMRCMRSYEVRHLFCAIMGNRWLLRHLNPLNNHDFFFLKIYASKFVKVYVHVLCI